MNMICTDLESPVSHQDDLDFMQSLTRFPQITRALNLLLCIKQGIEEQPASEEFRSVDFYFNIPGDAVRTLLDLFCSCIFHTKYAEIEKVPLPICGVVCGITAVAESVIALTLRDGTPRDMGPHPEDPGGLWRASKDLVGPLGETGEVGERGAVAFYDLTTNSEMFRVSSLCHPTAVVSVTPTCVVVADCSRGGVVRGDRHKLGDGYYHFDSSLGNCLIVIDWGWAGGQTVGRVGCYGTALGEWDCPFTLCKVTDEELVVADQGNMRFVVTRWRDGTCERAIPYTEGLGPAEFGRPMSLCPLEGSLIAVSCYGQNPYIKILDWVSGVVVRSLRAFGGAVPEHPNVLDGMHYSYFTNGPQDNLTILLCCLNRDIMIVTSSSSRRWEESHSEPTYEEEGPIRFISWRDGLAAHAENYPSLSYFRIHQAVEKPLPVGSYTRWIPTGMCLMGPQECPTSLLLVNAPEGYGHVHGGRWKASKSALQGDVYRIVPRSPSSPDIPLVSSDAHHTYAYFREDIFGRIKEIFRMASSYHSSSDVLILCKDVPTRERVLAGLLGDTGFEVLCDSDKEMCLPRDSKCVMIHFDVPDTAKGYLARCGRYVRRDPATISAQNVFISLIKSPDARFMWDGTDDISTSHKALAVMESALQRKLETFEEVMGLKGKNVS